VPRPEVGGGVTGMTVCVKVPLWLVVVVPGAPLPPFIPGGPPGPADRGLNLSTVVDTCAVSSMILWVVLLKLWCGVWVVGPVLMAVIIQRFSWAISKVVPLAGQLTGPRDLAKVLRLPGPHTSVTLFTSEVNQIKFAPTT